MITKLDASKHASEEKETTRRVRTLHRKQPYTQTNSVSYTSGLGDDSGGFLIIC